MPRYKLRTLLILLAIGPPILAGAWFMPFDGYATNCGGNNAARSFVSEYAMMMIMFAMDDPHQEFSLASASAEQCKALAEGPQGWGVSRSDILICTKRLHLDSSTTRRIVAVCDRPFTNVPEYLFRRAAPTHAVAYSDGGTALMSERELAEIDGALFVRVTDLGQSTP